MESAEAVRAEIMRQAAACAASLCPSEVARALAPDPAWRALMPLIRREAAALARAGVLDILRKGKPVDPNGEIRGVIRLRGQRHEGGHE